MRNVILSADGDRIVYSVPDTVADNLDNYCIEFCDSWLHKSPYAEKYRIGGGVVWYNEADFIEYLNKWIFPNEPSRLVKNLEWIDFSNPLPKEYECCPWFNF